MTSFTGMLLIPEEKIVMEWLGEVGRLVYRRKLDGCVGFVKLFV